MTLLSGLTERFRSPSALALEVRAAGLTYLSKRKLVRLEDEVRRVLRRRVPGDLVEFGVALGGSGVLLARAAVEADRRFVGYDVFGTIPPPTSEKDDAASRERFDLIEAGAATGIGGARYYGYEEDLYGKVVATFDRHGVPVDGTRVTLVQGLFEDSWKSDAVERIALAHIDCDWYDPVRFCLGAIADRLAPGGAVVIDDYHDYGGCRTATDEFLGARPDYARIEGRNLILRRKG